MSQMSKEQLEELKKNAEKMQSISSGKLSDELKKRQKVNTQGAVIGGVIGLIGAIALRKRPLYGIIVGAIAGRLVLFLKND